MVYRKNYKKYKRARSASKRKYKSRYQKRYYKKKAKLVSKWGYPGALSVEKKWVDVVPDTSPSPQKLFNGALGVGKHLSLLNGIATGSGASNRIGRNIRIVSIQLKGSIWGIMPTESNRVRVMIIVDTQSNNTACDIVQVLSGGANAFSFINLNYRDRFRVLMDESFTLGFVDTVGDPPSGVTVSPCTCTVDKYIKTSIDVTYSSNGSDIGAISTNSVYVLSCAGINGTADTAYSWYWNARLRYTDC